MQQIKGINFYQENTLVEHQDITLDKGKITQIRPSEYTGHPKLLLTPGFIDLQIYGAGERLFSADPTVESLEIMEDDLLSKGTTGFFACMATNSETVFKNCILAAKEFRSSARNFLGLHLEGPYLNPKRLGAHIPEFIRKATLDEVKALLDFGDGVIKMMTIAPELHDEKIIQYLINNGVIVSLGHSNATFAEATSAYDLGVPTTTHLFNAMSPIHHRDPGIPTALFNHNQAMASIIVDGQHLNYEVVKMAKKLLEDRLFLITDAVTACSTGPYQHIKKGDKYVMPDGTLSGSSLTMLQAVKNCVLHCDIELPEAIRMATRYPAKLLNIDRLKGIIKINEEANLLLLDSDLNLKNVFIKGTALSN